MRTIGLICIAALAACATDDGSSGDDTSTGSGSDAGSGSNTEIEINGKPASAYYAQFTHGVTHTNVAGAAAFAEQADGRNAFLVQFFLMPDHELQLFYAEGNGEVSSTGHSLNLYRGAQRARPGSWRIDGARLVLGDTMTCDGFTFNSKDALRCTLVQTVITAAANGRSGTFTNGSSASSPDDSEFASYTP